MDQKDPIAILAPVVRREDSEMSATETREQALSDADHLGVLYAMWLDQCRAHAYARYAAAVRDHAAPADAEEILKDTDVLWRTVRAAEHAGLDGGQVIGEAIEGRPFTGARSDAAVLDARIRKNTGHLPPVIRSSWEARMPRFAAPDLARYMAQVAAAMDDRQRRIGVHAAQERPLWAVYALGAVPGQPEARAEWERKAGQLSAYREITGWDHPGEAIGPEPPRGNAEAWAEWHVAFAVMARIEGIDVRHLNDGQLLARRRAYEAETSWAPVHVAEELRAARKQEQNSKVEATRHEFEAAAAERRGEIKQAALHQHAAGSWTALGRRAALVREKLASAHDTRCQWEAMTEPTRRLARAADIELKRRGVLSRDDQLRSAEPDGFKHSADKTAEVWVQPRLDGIVDLPRDEVEPLTPAEREQQALEALGLTPGSDQAELPLQVTEIAEYNRKRQAEIDERRSGDHQQDRPAQARRTAAPARQPVPGLTVPAETDHVHRL